VKPEPALEQLAVTANIIFQFFFSIYNFIIFLEQTRLNLSTFAFWDYSACVFVQQKKDVEKRSASVCMMIQNSAAVSLDYGEQISDSAVFTSGPMLFTSGPMLS
jgi:hypothetical protein